MRLLVIGFGDEGGDCSARVDCPVDDSFLHDRDGWRHSLEAGGPRRHVCGRNGKTRDQDSMRAAIVWSAVISLQWSAVSHQSGRTATDDGAAS